MALAANSSPEILPHFPGHTIIEQLYAGARTTVYRAVEDSSQRSVIIKLLQQDYPSFNELLQFRNQYTIMRHIADAQAERLDLARIVCPYHLEPHGKSYALFMEDFGSISLRQYLQQHSLSMIESLMIGLQLADILHNLCQHRVIHKDIKPANILIHPISKQVKLIDFSIATLLPRETREIQNLNVLEGTLAYLSPEQTGRMNRGIDYRSDFYALGVTLYELLTGQLPFQTEDPVELVHCHLAKLPIAPDQINPAIPPIVSEIVLKLMAKNAEDRYQSALGLTYDLESCITQWKQTGSIAAFVLGQRDVCDRFLIPEKLYGRATKVQLLLDAFERVAQGQRELMLVAGFSGIGKTAVVNEVHKPIARGTKTAKGRQRGYFIKGKYDQFQRNIPFSAFVQAFRDLMGQLLSESDAQLATWKAKILDAVGDNGQVMIDVIPELERIIGQQPPVPELSGSAAQSRFNLLLQKFIQVFTTPDHPLVMFLDDLQWADSASLNLLKLLMSDANAGSLLILGAYRDNEVLPAHPLMLTLEQIQKAQAIVNTITLEPLEEATVNQLVADTLNCSPNLAQSLTQLVYQKTQGNPFFTTQFLKALHGEGWIHFQHELGYWQCDLTVVRQMALTEDVVEFMAQQLQKLPFATQQALKLAACIGNQFDLNTLAIVSGALPIDTATNLWKALQEGLILPISETYKFFQSDHSANFDRSNEAVVAYKFAHDRIQQAAYSLIPEDQKQATHYQIGKLLLENLSAAECEEKIFDVVNQINIGRSLLQTEAEKNQLAELNLIAGQKAKTSTAYDVAKENFQIGIELLASDAWTAAYRLAFDLRFNLAETALMSGDFETVEATTTLLLELANSAIDRARIYVLKVALYSLQGQFAESIQAGLVGLQSLGITVDRASLRELVQEEFAAVEASLADRSIASLFDLPIATNLEIQAAIELLVILQPPAYIVSDFDLYSFSTFRAVRLSMEQGNTAESIKAYATYGFLIGLMHGQYQRGLEFADLALHLSYKLNSKFQRSGASFMLGCCIQVWAKPIQGAAEINYQGFLAGMESGELPHAGYNLYSNICNRLFQGENLADIAIDIEKYWLIGEKLQHDFLLSILDACRFFVHSLVRSLNELDQNAAAEQAWVERYEATQSHTALGTYHILQMHRACLVQSSKPSLYHLTQAGKSINGCAGFTTSAGYYYYGSLILLNDWSNLSETEQQERSPQIEANQAQLKTWSESCPENFLHKYLLIEAERSRIAGQHSEALELYDRAIAEAKANEYLQEEALANELAAKFYLDWGKEKVAAGYMQEAYYCYARWGAQAKTDDLEQRYADLLRPILQQASQMINPLETLTSIAPPNLSIHASTYLSHSSSTSVNATLDFVAVLKASQILSGTIQLDQLIRQLTPIILQHSGGDRCALMQPNTSGEWHIVAIATPEITELCTEALENNQQVPTQLIQYVKNTQEVMVIDNLKIDLPVIDEYLIQQQPKSVLCLPILHQGQLIGILSLENQSTSGVFTNDRILILNFLCTQAAISLENARLYQQAQTYAQQLEQSQLQLIQGEKMASLGNLVAGVAHEINNPIGFLNGSISNAQDYVQDLLDYLVLYQQYHPDTAAPVQDKAEDIDLEFLSEDLPKLLGSMQGATDRISSISTSLRTFSRADTEYKVSANLHEGIDSTILILKYRLKANDYRPAIQIIQEYGDLPAIDCFPGQLNQVFMNIIANAIDMFDEMAKNHTFGEIEANPQQIKIHTELDGNQVAIRIKDNGKGMIESVKSRIFDHLFTTKEVGKGTGLGLAIAHQIVVEKHGGSLTVQSEPDQGTEFCIQLPMK